MSVLNKLETKIETFVPRELRITLVGAGALTSGISCFILIRSMNSHAGFSILFWFFACTGIYFGIKMGWNAIFSPNEEWRFTNKKIEIEKSHGQKTKRELIYIENIISSEIIKVETENSPDNYVIELKGTSGLNRRSPKFPNEENAQIALQIFMGKLNRVKV